MMASKLMRFRESSGNIQYHHWDLPDDTHKRLYQFTMRGFDTFDQWVHFARVCFFLDIFISLLQTELFSSNFVITNLFQY